MDKIWIIGAGRFGQLALQRLLKRFPQSEILLVDPFHEPSEMIHSARWSFKKKDGLAFLTENLKQSSSPSWIIPALPIHLAAEWCHSEFGFKQLKRITLPDELDIRLPNTMRGTTGDLYTSNANFLCPDNCPEPENYCTVTKHSREQDMTARLQQLKLPSFQSIVLQSIQLAPGVGGFKPAKLFSMIRQVRGIKGPLLLSTACRCHGVVSGFTRT